MPTLEERVAYLEGRLADHAGAVTELRDSTSEMRGLLHSVDTKIDGLGTRLDARIDALDSKLSRHFTWLVGILLAALISALIGR